MSNSVRVFAILTAHAGHEPALEALLMSLPRLARAEPGNLRYDLWRVKDQPCQFVIDEAYTDMSAVEFHRRTHHFKAYAASINDLATRHVMILDAVDVV